MLAVGPARAVREVTLHLEQVAAAAAAAVPPVQARQPVVQAATARWGTSGPRRLVQAAEVERQAVLVTGRPQQFRVTALYMAAAVAPEPEVVEPLSVQAHRA